MIFKTKKSDLIKELLFLSGVVDAKRTIPIYSHVKIDTHDGHVLLSCTNGELLAQATCVAQVATSGDGTMPMKKLLDLVKLLPEGEIEFEKLENHQMQIRFGKKRYKMLGLDGSAFPAIPAFPKKTKKIGVSIISSLIRRVSFAIPIEESRYNINGALIILAQDKVSMVATDGFRMAIAEAPGEFGDFSEPIRVIIPRDAIEEIKAIASNGTGEAMLEFALDASTLFFRCGDRKLMARQLAVKFPPYEAVLPKNNDKLAVIDNKEFATAIARVSQMSSADTKLCRFTFSQDGLEIFTSSPESGEAVEAIECEYTGETLAIAFNSALFAEFLDAAGTDKIDIGLLDASHGADMKPNAGAGYRYVLMPMALPGK